MLFARLRASYRYLRWALRPDEPSRHIASPDGHSRAEIANAYEGEGPRTAVVLLTTVGEHHGGGGVFTASCATSAVDVRWLDNATIEISYPEDAEVDQRREETSFCDRPFRCVFRPIRR